MNDPLPFTPTVKTNPEVARATRRQIRLQIYLPFLIGLLLLTLVTILLQQNQVGTLSGWADALLIFMFLPFLLVGLLALVVVAGLAYGVIRLIGIIPEPAEKARRFLQRVSRQVRRGADRVAGVQIAPQAALSGLKAGIRSLTSIFRSEDR
jgi:predicted PurR-regulated permease PerM